MVEIRADFGPADAAGVMIDLRDYVSELLGRG